jgi:putative addiction module CopG family antidote
MARQPRQKVRQKVAIGDYETASEVVREGLRLLKQRDEVWKADVRDRIKQGMDSIRAGRTIPAEQVQAEMTAFKKKWKRTVARGDRRPPGNLGLYRQRQSGRSGQARRAHLCSMRAAREKSAPWPPTFRLNGRTRSILAGAGAIHGDLPARYRAAEDRPHSSGRPQHPGMF